MPVDIGTAFLIRKRCWLLEIRDQPNMMASLIACSVKHQAWISLNKFTTDTLTKKRLVLWTLNWYALNYDQKTNDKLQSTKIAGAQPTWRTQFWASVLWKLTLAAGAHRTCHEIVVLTSAQGKIPDVSRGCGSRFTWHSQCHWVDDFPIGIWAINTIHMGSCETYAANFHSPSGLEANWTGRSSAWAPPLEHTCTPHLWHPLWEQYIYIYMIRICRYAICIYIYKNKHIYVYILYNIYYIHILYIYIYVCACFFIVHYSCKGILKRFRCIYAGECTSTRQTWANHWIKHNVEISGRGSLNQT